MRILAIAYACDPFEGSEPGAGWSWVRLLSRLGNVTVITRRNNRAAIEGGYLTDAEIDSLSFEYVDLPSWLRFWKRGQRGVRTYYLIWQIAAGLTGRRLHAIRHFDLVWHLTLANVWLGSGAIMVKAPLVFGPVGGGIKTPTHLLDKRDLRSRFVEFGRAAARGLAKRLNPLARKTWSKATLILCQSRDTMQWLPPRYRSNAVLFPNALIEPVNYGVSGSRNRVAIYAGRLIGPKGLHLAVEALARLADWELRLIGDGHNLEVLKKRAESVGARSNVKFYGWQPRTVVAKLLAESHGVFLFPSLHDESPFSVVEALAAGLPVVGLQIGGAPDLVGQAGRFVSVASSRDQVITHLTEAIIEAVMIPEEIVSEQATRYLPDQKERDLRFLLTKHQLLDVRP